MDSSNKCVALLKSCFEDVENLKAKPNELQSVVKNLIERLKELRAAIIDHHEQESMYNFLKESQLNPLGKILTPTLNMKDIPTTDVRQILSFGFQFMVNFCTNNVPSKELTTNLIFENLATDSFTQLVEEAFSENRLIKFLMILTNNLILIWRAELLENCWNLPNWVYLLTKLFKHFFSESYCGKNIGASNDELFEWFYIFFKNLLTQTSICTSYQKSISILSIIWKLLTDEPLKTTEAVITSTLEPDFKYSDLTKSRLYFLFFLHNAFQKTIDEKSQACLIRDSNPRSDIVHEIYNQKQEFALTVTSQDFIFLMNLFRWLGTASIVDIDCLMNQKFENLKELYDQLNLKLEFCHVIIKNFSLILFLGGHNIRVQTIFIDSPSFRLTLDLFGKIYRMETYLSDNPTHNLNIEKIIKEDTYAELYLNFIRLLSNVVHINKTAQNFILNNDYLLLCLSFTTIKESNPYIKEWSVVFVRHMTDGNDEVQQKISELKMIDFDQKVKDLMKKMQINPKDLGMKDVSETME